MMLSNKKNVDQNNIKIDEKSNKNILIYYTGYIRYVKIKDSKYIKICSVNPLYFVFKKVNEYFEEINKSQYLTLVPTNESNKKNKNYEVWIKIQRFNQVNN